MSTPYLEMSIRSFCEFSLSFWGRAPKTYVAQEVDHQSHLIHSIPIVIRLARPRYKQSREEIEWLPDDATGLKRLPASDVSKNTRNPTTLERRTKFVSKPEKLHWVRGHTSALVHH
jgi:hypothetical protein